MKKITMIMALLLTGGSFMNAQESGYQFTTVKSIKTTPVKNQAATGTCWCFATTSFMETELLRMGKGEYDLSEMFIVRQKYFNQAEDNYLRRGHGNVGQGSLSHTWMNAFKQVGIVPEEVYSGGYGIFVLLPSCNTFFINYFCRLSLSVFCLTGQKWDKT